MSYQILNMDCVDAMQLLIEDNSVDAIVTDPPYGLSFMGKKWDYDVPSVDVWREAFRVLKPGGHLLAFAGTRTQHRMAVNIEDAGFEIRDLIAWVYGSGFPKSLDVSKAIDKVNGETGRLHKFTTFMRTTGLTAKQINDATGTFMGSHYLTDKSQPAIPTRALWAKLRPLCGEVPVWVDELVDRIEAEREVTGQQNATLLAVAPGQENDRGATVLDITTPATEAAKRWQGWGTALKPALETVTLACKPFPPEEEQRTILSNLIRLEARLWLLSIANAAESRSTSSRSEYDAACAIARWSADDLTSTRAALCEAMGTSQYESATSTSLNIVSSWRRTLEDALSSASTCTTETASSMTIDWRTLNFSLSQITPASIIQANSLPGGFAANANTAESHFNASLSLLQSIRTLSAIGPAISQAAQNSLAAGVKPNLDPCIMARKPLVGTVASNVLEWGTGALNVDGCRVESYDGASTARKPSSNAGSGTYAQDDYTKNMLRGGNGSDLGRWPANLIHDGSDEVLAAFPETHSSKARGSAEEYKPNNKNKVYGDGMGGGFHPGFSDSGSAARFFYCAKASKSDRGDGNTHPTVKPLALMRYLCRLVTPPGGLILDPFTGSGSTGVAALLEGFRFTGIERDEAYVAIAEARLASKIEQMLNSGVRAGEEVSA